MLQVAQVVFFPASLAYKLSLGDRDEGDRDEQSHRRAAGGVGAAGLVRIFVVWL